MISALLFMVLWYKVQFGYSPITGDSNVKILTTHAKLFQLLISIDNLQSSATAITY
ncbi:hypothetical protein PROSTU_00605 [Providencia stuartii ATCC 25827]|uniref:Uncharacterized protein n=1 Tax=Providencia stuartii ATCC 25827 TaxID=471874 RepID=A0AA86YQY5_PROST|nr:hypothetical protein PROSTU_00605 [Providencia stuartii ATCC 25827]